VAEMPMWASPFVSLALTSAVVPRASFLGHLAGIAAGFAVRCRPCSAECESLPGDRAKSYQSVLSVAYMAVVCTLPLPCTA